MIATLRPLTYDDLLQMPDDGKHYEIIGGELIVNPAPTANHQRVVGHLYTLLRAHARDQSAGEAFLAPFDVHLSHFDIIQPDIVFVSTEHSRTPGEQNFIEDSPELVVEVVSPSSRGIDCVRKMALYAGSGVQEYWIADPERRTVTIDVLAGDDYVAVEPDSDGLLTSPTLSGLRVDPAEVFADLN